MGTGASVMSRKLEEERRRQDETAKKAEELVSGAEQRHEALTTRLRSENAGLQNYVEDVQWALQQQTELWRQEKAKNVSMAYSRLPLPLLEAATGLSATRPDVLPTHLLTGAASLNKTYQTATIAFCDVVGFGSLSASLSAQQAMELLDKLHILVDTSFSADGLYVTDNSADTCCVITGLVDPTPKYQLQQKKESSRLGGTTVASSKVLSLHSEDAGYETKESEDEVVELGDGTAERAEGNNTRRVPGLKHKGKGGDLVLKTSSQKAMSPVVIEISSPSPPTSRLGPTTPALCAAQLARAALKLLSTSIDFHIPGRARDEQLQLRVSLHSGPCVVGVAGLRQLSSGMPPDALGYSVPPAHLVVLGKTPKEAEQLCKTSLALQIRVSQSCRELLLQSGVACNLERCPDVSRETFGGKSDPSSYLLNTYWLIGMETFNDSLPPLDKAIPLSEYDSF